LAKYLGEGTSRGATEKSVAPFSLSRRVVSPSYHSPCPSCGNQRDIQKRPDNEFQPFYFRNRVNGEPSSVRADFAYNFLTYRKEAVPLYSHDRIDILGLEKTYSVGFWRKKPKCALKPLHLRVEEGEIFGFLGPNGAGKTTTLKMLMGLVYPTAGSAKILGMDINDPRMKAQIGFLPEQPYFYDYLTAGELLNYYGQLSGVAPKERERKVREVLERVGLPDVMRVQLRKFSKGMLQRVGIAQAILHDPRIVFFDEPMSGLDPMGRREVRDLMEELKHEGKTVFFSTHILSDAEALCDRVAIIHLGELQSVGAVADLTSSIEGKIELIWHGNKVPASLKALGADCHVTGDTVRAVLLEGNQDAALEALRREQLRIVSLIPVRTSLEEYFVRKLQPSRAVAGVTQ
jgi:ABC-2 type transport system ATP-binding protein